MNSPSGLHAFLERKFQLKAHNTNLKTEFMAGLTTFLTMAYIIFVQPDMLSMAGMDFGSVFVATCLAAALGSMLMGWLANYPVALAPGMGLNAFFTFTVVGEMGYSWQIGLGAVFISGILFFILSFIKVREMVLNSIPKSLRGAITAGIGMFLGLIALKNAGIVVDHPATLVTLGDLGSTPALLAILGFVGIIALQHFRITGAVLIMILVVTAAAALLGLTKLPGVTEMVSAPPSLEPTFAQLDIMGALHIGLFSVIFALFFVDLFDTSGTLIAVANKGGLLNEKGELPRAKQAFISDSTATLAGSVLGTSTTTSYVESAAGVSAGGRTGLTAMVTGGLFLLCLFFEPIAAAVPAAATAPALFYVAVLMMMGLAQIDWEDMTEAAPAAVTALMMPFAFSIATGLALGFITFTLVKLLSGRRDEISIGVWIISGLFILKLVIVGG